MRRFEWEKAYRILKKVDMDAYLAAVEEAQGLALTLGMDSDGQNVLEGALVNFAIEVIRLREKKKLRTAA